MKQEEGLSNIIEQKEEIISHFQLDNPKMESLTKRTEGRIDQEQLCLHYETDIPELAIGNE